MPTISSRRKGSVGSLFFYSVRVGECGSLSRLNSRVFIREFLNIKISEGLFLRKVHSFSVIGAVFAVSVNL